MSSFAGRVSLPLAMIPSAIVSTEVYDRRHSSFLMPLFMLAVSGDDRSTISCHLPGLFFFGIIPMGLYWTDNAAAVPELSYFGLDVVCDHFWIGY